MKLSFFLGMLILSVPLLFSVPAQAAVVTVDVTITAVNPQARGITVVYKTELGEKTIELDVSRKAEISLNGKDAALDSLGAGLKAKVSYDKDLSIVTKVEAKGTPTVAKTPELIQLSELNDENLNDHPWLCEDGRTIYWHRRIGRALIIWTAHREHPDAPFVNKKSLFSGGCPTLPSDALEMIIAGERSDGEEGESLQVATREGLDKSFSRPKEITTLRSFHAWNPRLSADGLTLYFGVKSFPGKPLACYSTTRKDKTSPWAKAKPFDPPGFEESDIGFSFITPDGLILLGAERRSQTPSLMMVSRRSTSSAFKDPIRIEVNSRPLIGSCPMYLAATQELFFVRIPVKDGRWDKGKPIGIWVVKNFSPSDLAK